MLLAKTLTRARNFVAKLPVAVSGQHGHTATFRAAAALVHGFALSESDAMPILQEYNARCVPPWGERELAHKLSSASKWGKYDKPRGHLIGPGRRGTPIESEMLRDATSRPSSVILPPRVKKRIPPLWLGGTAAVTKVVSERARIQQQEEELAKSVEKDSDAPKPADISSHSQPFRPSEAQLVRIPPGLSPAQRKAFLARDLEEAFGVEDT